jgi:hypothetical protein
MAKIPVMGNKGRVRAVGDRPADASASAEVGAARQMQNLGRTLGGLGADLLEKRSKAEAAEFGDNKKREYRRELKGKELELKAKYKNDPKGYAEEMEVFAKERRDAYRDEAPTTRARQYFEGKTAGLFETTLVESDTYENLEKAKGYIRKRKETVLTGANSLYDAPDTDAAIEELNEFIDEVNNQENIQYTKDSAKDMNDFARGKYRYGLLGGLIGTGDEAAMKQAEDILQGRVEGTEELLSTMTPKEKSNYLDEINRKRKSVRAKNDKMSRVLVNNAIDSLSDGEIKTPAEMEEILGAQRMIGGIEDPLKRSEYTKAFQSAIEMQNVVRKIHSSSGPEIMAMAYGTDELIPDKGLLGYKATAEMRKKIQIVAPKIHKMREEDGAAYIQKNFKASATDPHSSYEMQKALGIKNARVVTKADSKAFAESIENAPDPETRLHIFDGLIDKYGPMSVEALDDLRKDKALPASIAIVGATRDNSLRMSFLDSVTNKSTHREEFKNNATFKAEKSEIPKYIQDKAGDFLEATADIMDPEVRNNMYELIEIEAMKNRKKTNNIEEAVTKAVEDVVDRHYDLITYDNGWFGADRTAVVPAGMNRRVVENFLERSLDHLDSEDLDIAVETNGWVDSPEYEEYSSIKTGSTFRRKIKDPKKKFFDQLAKRSSWVPNKTHTGYQLRYTDVSGKVGFIRDSKGNVVEKSFQEMPYLSFVKEVLD